MKENVTTKITIDNKFYKKIKHYPNAILLILH